MLSRNVVEGRVPGGKGHALGLVEPEPADAVIELAVFQAAVHLLAAAHDFLQQGKPLQLQFTRELGFLGKRGGLLHALVFQLKENLGTHVHGIFGGHDLGERKAELFALEIRSHPGAGLAGLKNGTLGVRVACGKS